MQSKLCRCACGSALGLLLALSASASDWTFSEATYLPYEGRTVVAQRIVNGGVTKEYVIRRELQQQLGEPFLVQTLVEDLLRLENLGIFSQVRAEVVEIADGIELEYHVTEMPWVVPYPAFRYNDENGWSVGAALSSLNLFGRHIGLAGRVLLGGTTTFEVKLQWPWIAYDHLSLDLTANRLVRKDELLGFEEESYEVTPWIGHYLGAHGRVSGTLGWFQMNADQDGRTLSSTNQDNLVRTGVRLGWDTRDAWRDPRNGWQNELEVLKVGGWLGGQGNYTQTTFDIRRFLGFSERNSMYVGNLTTLSTGAVGQDYPAYFLYRMGGANTIRGYDVKELGRTLYGKNQMLTTVEYHFSVLPLRPYRLWRWSVSLGLQAALFADLGVAWSPSSQFAWNRFKSGYGTGLRVLIPGSEALRLDLGFSQDGDVAFHFGPWFRWSAQRLRLR